MIRHDKTDLGVNGFIAFPLMLDHPIRAALDLEQVIPGAAIGPIIAATPRQKVISGPSVKRVSAAIVHDHIDQPIGVIDLVIIGSDIATR